MPFSDIMSYGIPLTLAPCLEQETEADSEVSTLLEQVLMLLYESTGNDPESLQVPPWVLTGVLPVHDQPIPLLQTQELQV